MITHTKKLTAVRKLKKLSKRKELLSTIENLLKAELFCERTFIDSELNDKFFNSLLLILGEVTENQVKDTKDLIYTIVG